MLDYNYLLTDVLSNIPAYREFIAKEGGITTQLPAFDKLPLQTKNNYLLSYELKKISREKDMQTFHLIGASSGFSKSGAIYWPKRPCDEAGYMQSMEKMFVENYHIDCKRTLMIECLAFGMWIGGMQIAAAIRNIALSGKYPFTIATPGLDFRATIRVIQDYKDLFSQILIITNPSNISLFRALLKDANIELPDGCVSFAVVGEYFTEHFREYVASEFGHPSDSPYVVWTGYGSADTGDVGAERASTIALRKYFHHHPQVSESFFGTTSVPMILALSSAVYVEIIDGNIIVTKDQFIPLIRYNTKDSGGLLFKKELEGKIPDSIYEQLPQEMIYVYGRADNAVIFYGTNLMVNDISDFLLSLPSDKGYGGLYTVHETEKNGITCFEFVIYVNEVGESLTQWYFETLIDFLCSHSAEFAIKYGNLSRSTDIPLITVETQDVKKIDSKVKHRFII
jgi:phenylacetate-CoA ligase